MPYLFKADYQRLVACQGRQGLSQDSLQEQDRHAEACGIGSVVKPSVQAEDGVERC